MTLSPFARLQPMSSQFEATEPVEGVFAVAVTAIEQAPNCNALIEELTGYDPADLPHRRGELILIAASVALQTKIEEQSLNVFVTDGSRFYRVPPDAFISQFHGVISDGSPTRLARRSIELSLSCGRLSEIDTQEDYRWLSELRLPLMTTERDSRSLVHWLRSLVEEEGALPMTAQELSDQRLTEQARARSGDLKEEDLWTLPETLLWIAFRDYSVVAELTLSLWTGWREDELRQSGTVTSMVATYLAEPCEEHRASIVVADPASELATALRRGHIVASGLRRDQSEREDIHAKHWTDLRLIDGPRAFDGDAGAFMHAADPTQKPFWTALRFSRATVVDCFPEQTRPRGPASDEDERLCSWFTRCELAQVLQLIFREGGDPKDYTVAARIVDEHHRNITRGASRKRAVDAVRKAVGDRRILIEDLWRDLTSG